MGDGVGEKSGQLWWPRASGGRDTSEERRTPKASKGSFLEGGRIGAEDLTGQTDLIGQFPLADFGGVA